MAYFITIDKTLSKKMYTSKLTTKEITQNDLDLMDSFGDPQVDFGGVFTGGGGFTLPAMVRNIRTGLPVSHVFDGVADVAAEAKADAWLAENIVKISDELTTLRGLTDSFTETTEQQL